MCGVSALQEIEGFSRLTRVTSDCKPYPPGGRLAVCSSCGGIQKYADRAWLAEIEGIYADYAMHHQSGEVDQIVLDAATGTLRPRCAVLAERLKAIPGFPAAGSWLDVGSGRGAMLQALGALDMGLNLHACDLDDRSLDALRVIPGFSALHRGGLDGVEGRFDAISMVHSLEHFVTPFDAILSARQLLGPRGLLFIQVNNTEANPFDMVVADHLTHFTPETLASMVSRAGFEVQSLATDWVTKELSLVARIAPVAHGAAPPSDQPGFGSASTVRTDIHGQIAWLERMAEAARAASDGGRIGIFGSAIAGTWLAALLEDRVDFFVDEDKARVGRRHMGKPILSPADVPPDTPIFIGLIPVTAMRIHERLRHLPIRLVLPPLPDLHNKPDVTAAPGPGA